MAPYRPPVIPEIAKAFENDPRTKLTRNMLQTGTSTAPVAQGGYAWADGLARAMQGVLGAVIEKKIGKKYAADEAELIEARRRRLEDMDAPPVDVQQETPAATSQIAAALGAPAPPQAAPAGLPGLPPAPAGPAGAAGASANASVAPQAAQAPPAPQAAPQGVAGVPGLPTIPGIPAPLEAPTAPKAVGPTQSPRLAMARRILQDGNRYESASGMEMLDKGLGEQGGYNEAAAGRQATLDNTGYSGAISGYNQDRAARVAAGYNALDREDNQAFTLTRDDLNFARDMKKAGFDRQTSLMLAKLNNDGAWMRTVASISATRATAQEKAEARRTAFFNTPTGAKIFEATSQRIKDADSTLSQLDEFMRLNADTRTGGMILGNVPGAIRWASGDLQSMERISQDMSIKLSGMLKGAVSDKEGERILRSIPTISNKYSANELTASSMGAAINRVKDFETRKLEAMAAGTQVPFMKEWNAYVNSVPYMRTVKGANGKNQYVPGMSFDDWKATLPTYGKDGQRTQ